MADNIKKLTYTIEINDKGKVKVDGLTKGFVKMDNAIKKVNLDLEAQALATSKATTAQKSMIATSGLAGATLTELGRTISDWNYGIRGVANNLSQLSTLFITLTAKANGFGKAISILVKQLRGPLGFILAFQFVIMLLERFDMQSKKAESSTKGFSDSIGKAGSDLKILRDVVDDNTMSNKELSDAVEAANKKYQDLNLSIGENGRLTEESIRQIDNKILALVRLAKATAIQGEMEKIYSEMSRARIEEQKEIDKLEEGRAKREEQRLLASQNRQQAAQSALFKAVVVSTDEAIQTVRDKYTSQREDFEKEIDILKNILVDEDLVDLLFNTKESGRGAKRRKEKILELFGVGSDLPNSLKESAQRGVDELFFIGEKYDEWVQKNLDSLKAFIKSIRSEAQDVSELFKAGQQSLRDVGGVFLSFSDARMEALARERDYILNSGNLSAAQQKKAIADIEKREIKAQEKKIKLERDLFTIKQSMFIAEEIMKAKFFAAEQIRIAQTAVANKVATAEQIALEGVAQIGKANMSLGAFMSALGPLGLPTFLLTIGGALASILAARKKAQSSLAALGAPSTGGGGGGVGVEAPDFNVVGASPESQLAQSVSKQQTQPLRAFVVHKDIKNANDLDRTITGTSALG